MFKGFIVVGVAYAVGWTRGYISGQHHTEELKNLFEELRNSQEVKEFFAEVRITAEELAKKKDEEASDEIIVDGHAEPMLPDEIDRIREN